MKRSLKTPIVLCSIFVMFTPVSVTEAGPFVDFFRAVRRSIAHPQHKPRSHSSGRKSSNNIAAADSSRSKTSGGGAVNEPPNQHNVREAKQASTAKDEKRRSPYGTPVPGKQGFVTSPFAPDGGYIDVRGFSPGTEVKDPYTGKIFLTP